jgi:hypothetical protein
MRRFSKTRRAGSTVPVDDEQVPTVEVFRVDELAAVGSPHVEAARNAGPADLRRMRGPGAAWRWFFAHGFVALLRLTTFWTSTVAVATPSNRCPGDTRGVGA